MKIFDYVSMTGTGLMVYLISAGLQYFGFVATDGDIAAFVNNILQVVGFIMAMVGQVRRKDLVLGIMKR